jgi:uncharacterized protein YggT (Ycf19 family)
VGDDLVGFLVLADTASSVQQFVSVFVGVYVLLIFAYIIASWIPGGGSPTLERIRQFLYDVCEPYLRLFRRVLPPVGPLDLSPMVAVIVLIAAEQIVVRLLDRLH